jgi:hypothetical protein
LSANLFWKKARTTRSLIDKPFASEDEFERLVFETSGLLEDIHLIHRQVRGGGKPGIPDIIGIDDAGAVCIVELKNKAITADVIPQVLEYAIWAGNHPDSIRALWLETEDRPEDLEIDWNNLQVRILLLAPLIDRSTLEYIERINYSTDLIEVKRWQLGKEQFIMMNRLEPDAKKTPPKIARGFIEYDPKLYREKYGKQAAVDFLRYTKEVEGIVRRNGWQLEKRFKKNSCVFKVGFFNAFSVRWFAGKTFGFSFNRLSGKHINRVKIRPFRYDKKRGRAWYIIEPGKTHTKSFEPLFAASYEQLASAS